MSNLRQAPTPPPHRHRSYGKVFAQHQAQSATFFTACAISGLSAMKEPLYTVGTDTDTVVTNAYLRKVTTTLHGNVYRTVLITELYSIADKVTYHCFQHVIVGMHRKPLRAEVAIQPYMLRLGYHYKDVHHSWNDIAQLES